LDRLFQAANDGCTNGIPIGPVVSDLIAEIVLAAIDRELSRKLRRLDILAVRFKDDYRFLCKTEAHGVEVLKELQRQLYIAP
jgi:retron-type reverse transcriptase